MGWVGRLGGEIKEGSFRRLLGGCVCVCMDVWAGVWVGVWMALHILAQPLFF